MTANDSKMTGVTMASYMLRHLDDEFWRKVKAKAALEGISVKDLILHLLAEWLKRR